MRNLSLLLMAAALIGATAAAHRHDAASALAKALEGHEPGKMSTCIDPQFTTGPTVIGHDTMLYRQGGTIWKANVIGPCPALREGVTVINDIWGGQLCRNDRFRVIEPGMHIPSAYCRLGGFQAYWPVRK